MNIVAFYSLREEKYKYQYIVIIIFIWLLKQKYYSHSLKAYEEMESSVDFQNPLAGVSFQEMKKEVKK